MAGVSIEQICLAVVSSEHGKWRIEAMNQELKQLERLLDEMSKNPSPELAEQLTERLNQTFVLVPAVLPKNTNPAVIRQMMQNAGGGLPAGANPQPGLLQNNKGECYLAVYTTEEELKKGKDKQNFPLILNLPFQNCLDMAAHNKGTVDGVVVNPFSQNVILHLGEQEQEQEQEEQEQPQLTETQLHAVLRRQFEFEVLPRTLMEGNEKAVANLKKGKGDYIMDLYDDHYEGKAECPYTEDSFDCMTLGISDTLQLTRITMPEQHNYPGTCFSVFVVWNPVTSELAYYGIEKTSEGRRQLVMVSEDGELSVLGDAPEEGGELQGMIDLVQK